MTGDQRPTEPTTTLNRRLDIDFALQAAELGVWEVDQMTDQVIWDERCRALFGLAKDNLLSYQQAIQYIHPQDVVRVDQAVVWAMNPESGGIFDQTYRTLSVDDGQTRWVRFQGKAIFSPAGQVIRFAGIAQDVTQQVEERQQLGERTKELADNVQELAQSEARYRQLAQELARSNEELVANNKELVAINEEVYTVNEAILASKRSLEVANEDLLRSNQNLEQFAYIASHDMQEPLRKIQQFGDMLQSQYGTTLGEGAVYLQRMQLAASRMSGLIRDLLGFSRIATSRVVAQAVSLTDVVNQTLEDLSVAVEESGAQISLDVLPIVQGDKSQLHQLFQNLLSNALKFRRKTVTGEVIPPFIALRAYLVHRGDLPASVQPSRYTEMYHRIDVADNGIGFEEQYIDRIFQVFQRLHGKNEFAGTGVGLAVVQKVVTNHGGAITATSQAGQGATFSVYLPA